MKKIFIALFVLASTQIVMAGATPVTKIKYMYIYNDSVVVQLENSHENSDGCTSSKSTSNIIIRTNTPAGNRHYSALLSAQVAKKTIVIGYRDCANWSATATLPQAYNVTILN